jgi:hypothetical protein
MTGMSTEVKARERHNQDLNITILNLLVSGQLIDCGELVISKSSLGKKRKGERYLVYLPLSRNYLWRALHGRRVRVFIEPLAESQNKASSMEKLS